ncbi:uncharacterized protein LOC141689013 [Apium graveolens]|uniref:uncharacterized protein LOC141689013 n=1 Tax=Apium graveolens TaxID=4045 RepID=UPI003D7A0BB7
METSKVKESTISLSYPMLARGNYMKLSLKMKLYMQAHGVWVAVEPKDPKKEVEETTDKLALAAIYQDRVKKARVQTLKAEFESLSMRDTEKLDDYSLKLNGLITNIRALGETIEEAYVVKKLPDRFQQRTKRKSRKPTTAYKEEWERKESGESKLLLTREEWIKRSGKGGNYNRNREGLRGVRDRTRVKCFNCHNYVHFTAECRKPERGKEQNQEANLTQLQDNEPALLLTECEKKGKIHY